MTDQRSWMWHVVQFFAILVLGPKPKALEFKSKPKASPFCFLKLRTQSPPLWNLSRARTEAFTPLAKLQWTLAILNDPWWRPYTAALKTHRSLIIRSGRAHLSKHYPMTASSLPYILAHFSPTHGAGTVLESSLMDSTPERPVEDAYGDSYLH